MRRGDAGPCPTNPSGEHQWTDETKREEGNQGLRCFTCAACGKQFRWKPELAGKSVIKAGTRGVGEVTVAKKKGMWGKSGKLETRLLYLEVGDQRIRISGVAGGQGKTGTAGVVASLAVVPIAGFFVTGTSATIPPRTATIATLDEDIPVQFAKAGKGR